MMALSTYLFLFAAFSFLMMIKNISVVDDLEKGVLDFQKLLSLQFAGRSFMFFLVAALIMLPFNPS